MNYFLNIGREPRKEPEVPEDLACALEASADDLRNDRVEDTVDFLDDVQRRIDAYFASRQPRV